MRGQRRSQRAPHRLPRRARLRRRGAQHARIHQRGRHGQKLLARREHRFDHFIKGLRRLTDAIHAHGGKAGIQLNHAGRLAQPAVSGHPRQLVSYIPGLTTYDDIHVMDEDDIERVIGSFCSAAERAAEAGFDVIEIHGAHGYLLSQFMSPLFNRRENAYGGNFEKRMRVPVEVIRGIRKRLGPDFPLFFRCSVEEYLPGGITLELARDIARTVADNGIDLFNVSGAAR
ncbi:MAG: hypothetical protein ACLR0N_06655 [Bilophila wadsworthia]